jgi:ribosomal protein S18 acetylase RimI-like enzyme
MSLFAMSNVEADGVEMSMSVRPIRTSEANDLVRFFEANNRPEITIHFHPFPLNETSARDIALTPRLDHYYAAWRQDQIVGFGMLRGWDEGYETPSFGVLVDYRCHGQGIGRCLLEFGLQVARRRGCRQVRLSVNASNPAAVHLYQTMGFGAVERQPTETAYRPDEKIIMVKRL